MKKKILLVLLVLLVILLGFLISEFSSTPKEFVTELTTSRSEDLFFTYEITKYPSYVEIVQYRPESDILIGVSVDPWDLNFGILSNVTRGRKYLILSNLEGENAKISLKSYGNISSMITFEKNDFIIHKNENMTITVFIKPLDTTKPGNYTGEVDVIAKIPKYDFMYYLL